MLEKGLAESFIILVYREKQFLLVCISIKGYSCYLIYVCTISGQIMVRVTIISVEVASLGMVFVVSCSVWEFENGNTQIAEGEEKAN